MTSFFPVPVRSVDSPLIPDWWSAPTAELRQAAWGCPDAQELLVHYGAESATGQRVFERPLLSFAVPTGANDPGGHWLSFSSARNGWSLGRERPSAAQAWHTPLGI